ncbi:MAG TPA: TadE family type IV pilus minor pilin [Segeticoccus sp.]|uniref:TadE family type IV pilus minor pilin n=1 Tax=Segeticoccus sp. TaxID=2706531 RepID=UPI002D7EEBBE|nr:TadE family type IV pilus minor pilin [Segeticoccus sp.]HET8600402.1 TadE family type IV pilus minor pilin [Segeticoccus sp.]
MATAEIAVALPAVVLVLAMALAGVGVAIDQVRCVDAARAAARAASRGDPSGAVRAVALRVAPPGAAVEVGRSGGGGAAGGEVRVTVSAPARLVGSLLPEDLRPHATAVGQLERAGGAW